MKKSILIAILAIFSIAAYSQSGSKSVIIKGDYKTEVKQFGIGVGARYGITDNIRIAPDAVFMFPKNHTTGLDINVNGEYVFPLQGGLSVYPLAGLNMYNTRTSISGESWSNTEFGFNIGCGFDYNLSDTNFLNAQFTYTFNDWDYATFAVGYGIRF